MLVARIGPRGRIHEWGPKTPSPVFFVTSEALINHLRSDGEEQTKSYPGTPPVDDSRQVPPCKPPKQRHEKLKESEMKREPEDLSRGIKPRSHTHSHGKSVTPQCRGHQEDFQNFQDSFRRCGRKRGIEPCMLRSGFSPSSMEGPEGRLKGSAGTCPAFRPGKRTARIMPVDHFFS